MPLTPDEIAKLADAIPDPQPRSRLDPYIEAIRKWRKRQLSYDRISALLADHFGVTISPSRVRKYLKHRSRRDRTTQAEPPQTPPMNRPETASAVRARFDKPATKPATESTTPYRFVFDESEPLTLDPKEK